jgi:hypothetical protein
MSELVLGGIRFALYDDQPWALDAEDAELSLPADSAPVLAQAFLTLTPDAALQGNEDAAIDWRRDGTFVHVRSRGTRVTLEERQAGVFVGEARLSTGLSTTSALLNAVACALAYERGGLVLHAVALASGSELIAVIGPPNAGKTTAANLCTGLRWYARDRLVVAEVAGRIFAWPLAGGEDISLPQHAGGPLQLSSLVRIVRDPGDTRVENINAGEAVLLVRESTHAPAAMDEGLLLDRALWLSTRLPVRRLRSRLDAPLALTK